MYAHDDDRIDGTEVARRALLATGCSSSGDDEQIILASSPICEEREIPDSCLEGVRR